MGPGLFFSFQELSLGMCEQETFFNHEVPRSSLIQVKVHFLSCVQLVADQLMRGGLRHSTSPYPVHCRGYTQCEKHTIAVCPTLSSGGSAYGWKHMAVQKPIRTWNIMSWMKLELQRTEILFQEAVASCFWLVYKFQEHINHQDRTESHQNIPSRDWVVMTPWRRWPMGDSQKLLGGIQKPDLQGLFCLLLA